MISEPEHEGSDAEAGKIQSRLVISRDAEWRRRFSGEKYGDAEQQRSPFLN
jgi:hypothetical protein